MPDAELHGVIDYKNSNRKTDYLYRISIKGVIFDTFGRVLVVKESGRDFWDLPGGGMDHGESIRDAIAREFFEEVGLRGDFEYRPIFVEDPKQLRSSPIMQARIVFHVIPKNLKFKAGMDGDGVEFVDPVYFLDASHFRERQIYKYAQLAAR